MDEHDVSSNFTEINQLKKYARDLADVYSLEKERRKELEDLNAELQEAYLDTIYRLSLAAEYRDEDTGDHIVRMGRYAGLIAGKCGLPAEDVINIRYAAPMHDVGKIGIPDNILLNPGKLTKEEFEIMKTHTIIGAKLLANSKAGILKVAEQIAQYHHERWDGLGYPYGLSGEDIPLAGRIVGLLDVFDALISKRPYKDPYPVEIVLDIIKKERGKHFDPDMVDILLDDIDELLRIRTAMSPEKIANGISRHDFALSERDEQDRKKES